MTHRYTIKGAPTTKKNSLRILKNKRTGKSFVAQSAQHNQWAVKARMQLALQHGLSASTVAIDRPVNMAAVVYRQRATGDLLNYLAAVSDALEGAGVVSNDKLIVSLNGSRMDKDAINPRVEIELTVID